MADLEHWTQSNYLRDERFPQLKGDVTNQAGSVVITMVKPMWNNITLQNSWVNYGSGNADAQYCVDSLGIVRIRGTIKSGTFADGTILFSLPAGARPPKHLTYPVIGAGTTVFLNVYSTGEVRIYGATGNTFLHLLGEFSKEA